MNIQIGEERETKEQNILKETTGCRDRVEVWLEVGGPILDGVVREGFGEVVILERRYELSREEQKEGRSRQRAQPAQRN